MSGKSIPLPEKENEILHRCLYGHHGHLFKLPFKGEILIYTLNPEVEFIIADFHGLYIYV